jgi:hypothetical protein
MKHYPVQKDKIDRLKQSIEQTGFWDNILCRKHGNKYQLAYGHHRLQAIKELNIIEVDIPVKDISDADMVRIMALENREQEDMSQTILIETVRVVRDFLSSQLNKYNDWEEFRSFELGRPNFPKIETEPAFRSLKAKGVGHGIITDFLGGGWKNWKISSALDTLNASDISMDAVRTFDTTGMADGFKRAIRSINKEVNEPIPLDKQTGLADKVKQRLDERKEAHGKTGGVDYYSAIKDIIKEEAIREKYVIPKKQTVTKENFLKYESYIAELRNKVTDLEEDLRQLISTEKELGDIQQVIGRIQLIISLTALSERIKLITKNQENENSKQTSDHLKRIGTGFEN